MTLYYFNLPCSLSYLNSLQHLLTFKQFSIHSFFQYMHQGGAMCHSIIHAAARPRGPGLCFHAYVWAAGQLKLSFSPLNTHSQTYSTAKNTLHHKSRLEHAKVIYRQVLLTHTPHMSAFICVADLQACPLCIVSMKYKHKRDTDTECSHPDTYSKYNKCLFIYQ